MYPWMEFLKTNGVGMGEGEDVSVACFLISTSTLCVDLNLVVGFFPPHFSLALLNFSSHLLMRKHYYTEDE